MKKINFKISIWVFLLALMLTAGPVIGAALVSANRIMNDEIKVFNNLEKKGNVDGPQFVQDEIIVKYKNDDKPFRILKVPYGQAKEKVKEYKGKKEVEFAELNYIAEAYVFPNDEYYQHQWNFDAINMESAWQSSTGSGTIVAVIDTGIAYEDYGAYEQAPDLVNTCFVQGYDFINGDTHANDDNAHGTHVAGTIAQSTDNVEGVAGIAFDACLMPVKVLNSRGSGTYAQIADGIYYAANNHADVINMSLGGVYASDILEDAVIYAYNKGVVIVAAAGNENVAQVGYPAAYDNVIAVGASDYDNNRAPYSCYGPDLDIVAPGGNTNVDLNGDGYSDGILQNTFKSRKPTDFSYYFYQGTSMASPHVAGVAALILSLDPTLSSDSVFAILTTSSSDLGDEGWDVNHSYGLLDAQAALEMVNPPVLVDVTYYKDFDNDGYGDINDSISTTTQPDGYVLDNANCDDTDANINPGEDEICDGIDNDCDLSVDEDYLSDVYGLGICAVDSYCSEGVVYIPELGIAQEEVCDFVDNDCDGQIDEGFDIDGDGITVCAGDCDDNNVSVYLGAEEVCDDNIDNNCDGEVDEGCGSLPAPVCGDKICEIEAGEDWNNCPRDCKIRDFR